MKKVILIHGYTSNPKKTKYKIIAEKLRKLGVDYAIPKLPGDEYPDSDTWLKIIDREVKSSKEPIILVGHSLGTRAALLYLDQYNQKIDTVILVAAFDNNIENRKRRNGNYANFFEYALNIDKIKGLVKNFIIVHSKDDPDIPYQQAVNISNDLNGKLITYEARKHFGGEKNAPINAKIFIDTIKSAL